MNKQELIKEYENIVKDDSLELCGCYNMADKNFMRKIYKSVLEDLERLDEPQKVEIPMFAADFIAEQKKLGHTLSYSIDASMSDRVAEWYWDNSELFARAWLDGYQTEKENRYIVKLKGINSESEYLYYGMGSCTWRFREKNESGYFRKEHTRKELEEAGFGDVFNSPLFEIEEVEE